MMEKVEFSFQNEIQSIRVAMLGGACSWTSSITATASSISATVPTAGEGREEIRGEAKRYEEGRPR